MYHLTVHGNAMEMYKAILVFERVHMPAPGPNWRWILMNVPIPSWAGRSC
jgi:hypothetical protein